MIPVNMQCMYMSQHTSAAASHTRLASGGSNWPSVSRLGRVSAGAFDVLTCVASDKPSVTAALAAAGSVAVAVPVAVGL